jgi:DNA-binding IclR family transcriptional regulator
LSTAPISFPQAQVQIIKVGKQQGDMTLTDFVVATELPPAQVKETLMELEHLDLVRSHNRESDGVVAYQVA